LVCYFGTDLRLPEKEAEAMKNTGDVQEFERRVAIEQLITSANRVASLAGSLRSIGAMEEDEFNGLRARPKTPEDATEMETGEVRVMTDVCRQEVADLEDRRETARRLLAEDAGVAYVMVPVRSRKPRRDQWARRTRRRTAHMAAASIRA
jgi:hypothetical protein